MKLILQIIFLIVALLIIVSIRNLVSYPEAGVDTQSVTNQPTVSVESGSSPRPVWTGPNGLFIQYVHLRQTSN